MGKWAVRDDGANDLFVVMSLPGGMVSMHIPSPDPLIATREQAEQIRLYIGAAIGDVKGPPS